jgi:hypothetical protein
MREMTSDLTPIPSSREEISVNSINNVGFRKIKR